MRLWILILGILLLHQEASAKSSDAIPSASCEQYLPPVVQGLRNDWEERKITVKKKLTVKLQIKDDGTADKLVIESSSGDAKTDKCFVKLLKRPNRFPSLPPDVANKVHVTVRFSVIPELGVRGAFVQE
jgi:TonB family protein